jgi:hypothetical protein
LDETEPNGNTTNEYLLQLVYHPRKDIIVPVIAGDGQVTETPTDTSGAYSAYSLNTTLEQCVPGCPNASWYDESGRKQLRSSILSNNDVNAGMKDARRKQGWENHMMIHLVQIAGQHEKCLVTYARIGDVPVEITEVNQTRRKATRSK